MQNNDVFSFVNSKGQTYFLNTETVTLKNGRTQQIYYFSRDIREEGIAAIPEGMQVIETSITKMPVLKKI